MYYCIVYDYSGSNINIYILICKNASFPTLSKEYDNIESYSFPKFTLVVLFGHALLNLTVQVRLNLTISVRSFQNISFIKNWQPLLFYCLNEIISFKPSAYKFLMSMKLRSYIDVTMIKFTFAA